MMPEQPTPNDPSKNDRDRHMKRCSAELRPVLDNLDAVIQSNFPDVEVDWEPRQWVGYWICNRGHLWVVIWTRMEHLELVIRVRKEFDQPDLATILGVSSNDVGIDRGNVFPIGIAKVRAQIKKDFNPDSEPFLSFLKKAHDSALEVWG
jgi:hypothetical protein